MQSRILCVHIETSSLWAEFVNKNRCFSVPLVSEEDKSIKLDFLCERWIPCQAVTSVLCLLFRPGTVHCSTKNAYTSELTIFTILWAKPTHSGLPTNNETLGIYLISYFHDSLQPDQNLIVLKCFFDTTLPKILDFLSEPIFIAFNQFLLLYVGWLISWNLKV